MANEPLDYRSSNEGPGPTRCPACGSERTVKGTLADAAFKPVQIRKLFSISGSLRVDAIACAACGALSLCVDREKLVDLAGEP